MIISLEKFLQKIDVSLMQKSKKDIAMIYIMIFATPFTISYLFFWDTSLHEFEKKNGQITTVNNKINQDNLYLQYNPPSKLIKLGQDIQNANSMIITTKDHNEYIKHKIETIVELVYDERAWGEYLHSISTNAAKHHIVLNDFTNKLVDKKKSFGHILNVNIDANGNYIDTLKFINSLETSNLVVDLHDINIIAKENLNFDLNLSVWGITY